ncbi:unnamed protein product, partial [Owenia fusiformis]
MIKFSVPSKSRVSSRHRTVTIQQPVVKKRKPPPTNPPWYTWPDSEMGLERLYDVDNMDHIPEDKRLDQFQQRDLHKTHFYKTAAKIFGPPKSRKRVIIAPPMEKPVRFARLQVDDDESFKPLIDNDPDLDVRQPRFPTSMTSANTSSTDNTKVSQDEINDYKDWITKRKKFRKDIDQMGLREEWLVNKPNKTALEKRVLRRMIAERLPKPETPKEEEDTGKEPEITEELPIVHMPSPLALQIIEEFLHQKKMRLYDLFRRMDKDGGGKLTREEFRNGIRNVGIPISDLLLEDLIIALDYNFDDEIEFKELNMGMEQWKKEKKETKKKNMVANASGGHNGSKPPTIVNISKSVDKVRPKSGLSTISDKSGLDRSLLSTPPPDTRAEQMVLSSEEAMLDLRKRDKAALARLMGKKVPKAQRIVKKKEVSKVIKTGIKGIDDHSMPSTLEGDTASLIDEFRQLKLKEYHAITKLCQDSHIELSEQLLQKVLLYPPELTHKELKKRIKQPGDELLSSKFADPPKKPKTPIEIRHKDKVKRSKTGKLLMDTRYAYPQQHSIANHGTKVTLPHGKVVIRRKTDCWMTFEEYDRLTKHLAIRYQQLHGRVQENVFWPGHLLDKLRLHM